MTPPEQGGAVAMLGLDNHAFVSIVGTRAGTNVKVTVTAATAPGGGVPALKPGESYDAVLDEGDVLQLETSGPGTLSGTEIVSDKAVVVESGNVCASLGVGRSDCDQVVEAMYPVGTWGKDFVFLDLRMPERGASTDIWGIIVASEDGTAISFDAPRALDGLPTAPIMLDKGQVYELTVHDPLAAFGDPKRAHFTMSATKPITVEALMGMQEGGAIVVPVDQFLDDYLFSAHPWFSGYLLATRKAGTPVTLDGALMDDKLFTPAGGGFEVSYLELPRCETDITRCGHRLTGAKVGVSVTANGGVCNYCYAGGAGAACVNATAGCL
jgi:hypothetical protein